MHLFIVIETYSQKEIITIKTLCQINNIKELKIILKKVEKHFALCYFYYLIFIENESHLL